MTERATAIVPAERIGASKSATTDIPITMRYTWFTMYRVSLLAINESRVLRSTKVAVAGWGSSCVGDVSGLGVWWGLWWRW